jgi:uncharacterized DUF497 family protein
MGFEWDIYKAVANYFKHGISFSHAMTAFDDSNALIFPCAGTWSETRYQLIGMPQKLIPSDVVHILTVVYTTRPENVRRIISARRASQKEKEFYERKLRP